MTRRTLRRTRCKGERGVVAVMVALFVVVLVGIAGLVVDLAVLRQDRAADREAADLVASAAATGLARTGATMDQACQDGWAYFQANVADTGASLSAPDCAVFSGACNPAVSRTATGTAGPYTVSITNPVVDGDPMMEHPDVVGGTTQAADPDLDGAPCERIGVRITRERKSSFSSVLGVTSTTTNSRSVAKLTADYGLDSPINLLLLDPTGCNVLTASGQASIVVHPVEDKPGYITLDSDGKGTGITNGSRACTNANSYTVDALGNQNSQIIAQANSGSGIAGVIRSYALAPGQGNAHAYDPNDVTTGRLSPKPTAATQRIGRTRADWKYNCLKDGVDGVPGPNLATGIDDDCPDYQGRPSYIAQLVSQIGSTSITRPSGYTEYPRAGTPGDKCSFTSSDPPVTLPAGDWWVNCPAGFSVSNSFTFTGGNVVFQGSVSVGSQGSLKINDSPVTDATVFVRSGGSITKGSQASVSMKQTFVYLANGMIDIGAGTGSFTWTAPDGGNFPGLALWSESTLQHRLGGQASMNCVGVFFMPNADPFTFQGQGTQTALQIQLITFRLDVSGQGVLDLLPVRTSPLTQPAWGSKLIR